MSSRSSTFAAAAVLTAGFAGAICRPPAALAYEQFLERFKLLYPTATTPPSKLTQPPVGATCVLMCHRTGTGREDNLSLYGRAFKQRLEGLTDSLASAEAVEIDEAFRRLERDPLGGVVDSDGDGFSNLHEIKTYQTFPGDPNDRPRVGAIESSATVEADVADSAPANNLSLLSIPVVNTVVGIGVLVAPLDEATETAPVTLTFSRVDEGGDTTLEIGSSGPPVPPGFEVGSPGLYYEIATTARYSPPVVVCIDDQGGASTGNGNRHLLHHEAGAWVDITTSAGPANGRICGATSSLSPFTVAARTDFVPPVTTAVASATGWTNSREVAVSLSAVDEGGAGVGEIVFALTGAETRSGVLTGDAGLVEVLAEGVTTVTYFARDTVGNAEAPKSLDIRIDRTPPAVGGLPEAGCTLWPANHRMARVASVTATDALSGLAGSPQVTATSSEPDDGVGAGSTSPDVLIEDGTVWVRAERSGVGVGRAYEIRAVASDLAGNTSKTSATCVVPHDRRPR